MYQIKVEPVFKADYARVCRKHPQIKDELKTAVSHLMEEGTLSVEYRPHRLDNCGGNYNNHIDFHLSDGLVDVIVLYMPHKTNPVIRLVRMGTHEELFRGALK